MQPTSSVNGQPDEVLARLRRLQALTASLSEAVTSEQVADALLLHSLDVLGAEAGVVYRLDDDGAEFVALRMVGYPEEVVASWGRFPADARTPVADAVRQRGPVVVPSLAGLRERYPLAASFPTLQGEAAAVALPLQVRDRVIGGVGLRFPTGRTFSEQDLSFMLTLAGLCAQALDRARLYDAERAAREALRERETTLQAILDNSPSIIFVKDAQGRYLLANRACQSFSGEPPERMLGKTDRDYLPAEYADRFRVDDLHVLRTGQVIRYEEEALLQDQIITALTVKFPLRDASGQPYAVCGIATDITDLKKAGAALRESESRFRGLWASNMIGVGFWDASGRVTDPNDAFLKMTGYSREDFLEGRIRYQDLTPEEYRAADEAALAQTVLAGACDPYEKEYVRKDGSRIPVLIGGGSFEGCRDRGPFFALDLSALKRAEQALDASGRRLQAVFDTSLDAILLADDQARYVDANPAACRLLGYDREQLLRLSVFDITPAANAEAARIAWAAFLRDGEQTGEYEVNRRDGTTAVVEFRAVARIQPGLHLSMLRDVTGRKKIEADLKMQARVLESMTEGVRVSDEHGIILYTNPAEDRMFGYGIGEMVGQHVSLHNAYLPEENERKVQAVIEHLQRNGAWLGEWSYRRKDGTPLTAFARITALEIGGRKHWVCVHEDITARKAVEQALRESEERLRTLSDNLPQGAIYQALGDQEGQRRFLYISAGVERLFGVTPAEAMADASSLYSLVHEDDRPRVAAAEEAALRDAAPFECEFRSRTRSGSLIWVEARSAPRRLQTGETVWEGVITDVTARRRAEEEARRFQFISDHSSEPHFFINRQARILYVNEVACERLGYNKAELLRMGIPDIDPLYDQPRFEELFDRSRRERVRPFESEHRRKDGSTFPVEISLTPVAFEGQDYLFAVARDITDRKKAEQERDRLISVIEYSPDFIGIADLRQQPIFLNRAGQRLVGLNGMEEASHTVILDYFPEDERVRVSREVMPVLLEKGHWDGEIDFRHFRTGERIPVRWNVFTLPDPATGQPAYFACVSRDIREQKQTDRRLREQYDLTRTITDNATTAIFMMDERSRCTFLNRAAEAMTGFQLQEVQGGILHDFIHHHRPDGTPYPMPECPIDRALPEQFDVVEHEDVFIRKNGEFFPVLVNAKPIRREGRAVGTVIEVRDVTAAKQAEAAARERSEQVQRLAEVAARINMAGDVASVLGVVTEEARYLIGAHQAVTSLTVDQNWSQAINAVSLSEKYAAWRSYDTPPNGSGIYSLVCRTNRPMRLTQVELETHPAYRRFGEDARHPPMRGWLAAPLIGRDGRNLGLVQLSDKVAGEFTADDEAVLVQLAQMASVAVENARLVESLKEADRRKDEFLATLAHELRNPLAPLRNGLQVIKLAMGNAEAVEQAQGLMERQLTQMVRLVDDLLDVSRITRGKLQLRRERVDLATVVQSAVESSRPLIEASAHELSVGLPAEPVWLDADATRLAQVLSNLLTNAAKYTEKAGRIWLTAERQGDTVVISVRDTGIGIPPEHLPRLFEMFSQVDSALERSQGGLGIGLSLVKGLVEMHGGSVTAHSEGLGRGSEFVVRLHAVDPSPAPDAAASAGGAKLTAAPRRRILVADDNRDAADSLAMMLRLAGHEVHAVHDGQEAVDAAGWFRPDVAFLDIGMPKLTGYEVARRIREGPWSRHMVLVAITGWGQEEDKRRANEAGFDQHLTKPVDPAALERLLSGLLKA